MHHILYLGYFSHNEIFQRLCNEGLDLSVARQKFDECFIKHLSDMKEARGLDLDIISYLPQGRKTDLTVNCGFDEYLGNPIKYVFSSRSNPLSMCNAVIKTYCYLREWIKKTNGEKRVVLTYATNPILLMAYHLLPSRPSIVTICSEVPNYRLMTVGGKQINSIKKKVFSYFNGKMDGYIFMSKYMNEICNPKGKPWTVVEGMVEVTENNSPKMQKPSEEIIFYAGGLHYENGIDILVQAMQYFKLDSVKLVLCGDGNAKEYVIGKAKADDRIQYLGSLPNDQILELEREATLLINPRKPNHLLTRYSFPSKTFEYFNSETPCMITKLDGIPEEYYNYCFTCDVTDAKLLHDQIEECFSLSWEERKKRALEAKQFLRKQKSAAKQTEKIIDFLFQFCEG